MTRVESYFPNAVRLAQKPEYKLLDKQGAISSQYKGYISSFGTTILQCGLLPAVALFSKTDGRSEKDKLPLLEIIWELVKPEAKQGKMLDYLIELQESNRHTELQQMQARVLDAAIALKLAIRTFKIQ